MEKEIKKIQEMIQTLIEKLGCSGSVDFIEYPENVYFSIHTKDGGLLIGENGERLRALNHIIRRITEYTLKDQSEVPKFFVDVNDYQKQKIEEVKDLARLSAQRVRYFKKEVAMQPMSAYERRVVHATLTEYPDIATQSTGEGAERKVVIKPL
ncbi:hypothetical protein IIA95_00065 [Patescibacteria group bacterium]|nr:hypothetical protein [Patescibacteria group bacterium]